MSATAWLRQCVALFCWCTTVKAVGTVAGTWNYKCGSHSGVRLVLSVCAADYNRTDTMGLLSPCILVHTKSEEGEISFEWIIIPDLKHSVCET